MPYDLPRRASEGFEYLFLKIDKDLGNWIFVYKLGLFMAYTRVNCDFIASHTLNLPIFPDFWGIFYGMKRARVGAFTDFGGFRYRNPVQILAHFLIFPTFLGFSGLV